MDCEVNTEYYCGGKFDIDGGCGASGTCAVSSQECETYWRNANYQSCDKCCPDVKRWNGEKCDGTESTCDGWEPVIDRNATCYNLVKRKAEECNSAETEAD